MYLKSDEAQSLPIVFKNKPTIPQDMFAFRLSSVANMFTVDYGDKANPLRLGYTKDGDWKNSFGDTSNIFIKKEGLLTKKDIEQLEVLIGKPIDKLLRPNDNQKSETISLYIANENIQKTEAENNHNNNNITLTLTTKTSVQQSSPKSPTENEPFSMIFNPDINPNHFLPETNKKLWLLKEGQSVEGTITVAFWADFEHRTGVTNLERGYLRFGYYKNTGWSFIREADTAVLKKLIGDLIISTKGKESLLTGKNLTQLLSEIKRQIKCSLSIDLDITNLVVPKKIEASKANIYQQDQRDFIKVKEALSNIEKSQESPLVKFSILSNNKNDDNGNDENSIKPH